VGTTPVYIVARANIREKEGGGSWGQPEPPNSAEGSRQVKLDPSDFSSRPVAHDSLGITQLRVRLAFDLGPGDGLGMEPTCSLTVLSGSELQEIPIIVPTHLAVNRRKGTDRPRNKIICHSTW
jgi:hypothetical protein